MNKIALIPASTYLFILSTPHCNLLRHHQWLYFFRFLFYLLLAYIYMNNQSYSFYISAISTLGYLNAYNMNGQYEPVFEGYKIAVCPGMVNNELVIAQKSNMFFGTDLLSDATRIQLLDMAQLDGSDNMRMVCKYSAGVQTGIGANITRVS